MSNPKGRAHELIERLPPSQLTAVIGLLEAMLDPVSRAIAQAPLDDEPETEQEHRAVAEAKEWLQHHPGIPFEEVLSDFGLTVRDLEPSKESK
ncbi:MAG: hypothetical protein DMG24_05075 [Acidobacteria bacterium]|nr:MAG: hypothetical protein DMG24_05075 [Acidobacteriota bacterium]